MNRKIKIYCAGPLFNDKEKEEMFEIADVLEGKGFNVFLPHRDGLEFADLLGVFREKGVSENSAQCLLNKAIFILDVYQVIDSDGLVLNINGRVPDEGATVEAGIAWNAGKEVVIYKNDARTLLSGNDNPLLLGLAGFDTVNKIYDIPAVFEKIFEDPSKSKKNKINSQRVKDLYKKGKYVSSLASKKRDRGVLCDEIINLLGGEKDV